MSDQLEPELERVARMLANAGPLPDAPETLRERALAIPDGGPAAAAEPAEVAPPPASAAGRGSFALAGVAAAIAAIAIVPAVVLTTRGGESAAASSSPPRPFAPKGGGSAHVVAHGDGSATIELKVWKLPSAGRQRLRGLARHARAIAARSGSSGSATTARRRSPTRCRASELAGYRWLWVTSGPAVSGEQPSRDEDRALGSLTVGTARATVRLAAWPGRPTSIDVLDHGFVRLDAVMADDLSVVNAARVSFGARVDDDGRAQRGTRALPHARAPRHAVRAQLLPLPHQGAAVRDARVAAAPRRLVQRALGPLLGAARRVLRAGGRRRAHAGRQARRLHLRAARRTTWPSRCGRTSRRATPSPTRRYQELLAAGVAKEVARTVLPVGLYTEFYWSVNARSLMNFLSLRNAPTAQHEIRALRGGRRAALRARDARDARGRSSRRDGRLPERAPAARARGARTSAVACTASRSRCRGRSTTCTATRSTTPRAGR